MALLPILIPLTGICSCIGCEGAPACCLVPTVICRRWLEHLQQLSVKGKRKLNLAAAAGPLVFYLQPTKVVHLALHPTPTDSQNCPRAAAAADSTTGIHCLQQSVPLDGSQNFDSLCNKIYLPWGRKFVKFEQKTMKFPLLNNWHQSHLQSFCNICTLSWCVWASLSFQFIIECSLMEIENVHNSSHQNTHWYQLINDYQLQTNKVRLGLHPWSGPPVTKC